MSNPPHELPPPAILTQLITGKFVTQMLAAAAHLGIADHLKNGPRTSDAIAADVKANPDAIHRLMRGLGAVGVLVEHDGRAFSLTPVGECLRADAPGSLAGFAKFMGASWHSQAWAELMHSLQTGEPAFVKAHG